ncbi:hypothetical protein RND81_03G049600 [Saponaria officinalis]|uniref:Uncharacterized protein n=1 Tax=Saponaria officinalis TaxID=3572 RepID=A0AAW1M2Q8_SAPOF
MNMIKILAFKNKPPAPVELMPRDYASVQQTKPVKLRRHIPQGLIGQYAAPILEEKSVWGTDAPTRIAYMDTQGIARLTFIALRNENLNRKLLTFAGPRAWTAQEVQGTIEKHPPLQ